MPIERVFRFNKNRKIAKPVEDIKPIALPYNKEEERYKELYAQQLEELKRMYRESLQQQRQAPYTGGMVYTLPNGYYTPSTTTPIQGTITTTGTWNNNVQVWTGNGWSGTVTKSTL